MLFFDVQSCGRFWDVFGFLLDELLELLIRSLLVAGLRGFWTLHLGFIRVLPPPGSVYR